MTCDSPYEIAGYSPVETAPDGYYYDPAIAEKAVSWFSDVMTHVKAHRGPLVLAPWQADATRILYGWRKPDGSRRYRQTYWTVPRKNGKSTWVAGIANYELFCSGEPGFEGYFAATDREQAGLCYSMSSGMVRNSPALDKRAQVLDSQKRIIYRDGFLRAIPANEGGSHGFNSAFIIADELHAWRGREFYDVLNTSTGSRSAPLFIVITTAGYDRTGICYKQYEYAKGVRDGKVDDPEFFPLIYEAEKDDDWKDPDVWAKANPNYGVSISKEYIARECRKAQEDPSYENTFRRLHLNQWTSQQTRWLAVDTWNDSPSTDEPIEKGARVVVAIDLSSTTDLTAKCVLEKKETGWKARWNFWIPEKKAEEIQRTDKVPYDVWIKKGLVTAIPGFKIDQSWIERTIERDYEDYEIKCVAYDPWNGEGMAARLEHDLGVPTVKVSQGFQSLSAPAKELQAIIAAGLIDHGNNPVVEWMVDNVEIQTDVNGNIRPVRPEHGAAGKKIDGIVALIIALAIWLVDTGEDRSIYEDEGFDFA